MTETLSLATEPRQLPKGFRPCSKTPKDGTPAAVIGWRPIPRNWTA